MHMHFVQKTYYFQKIVTSPFLGQKLQMTHQNVRKKEGFYPIIITCLLFLEKNGIDFFDNGEVTASLRYAFHTKTYYFQKIVTSPFLCQKLRMTHQNVRKKKGFYPIIITCLFCLLFLKKNGVDFFDNGEVTASLRYAFHTKNILFPKNCHVAVSGSKVTYDPSKCSQEKGLLPYHHNLFVMFVIFEKKWR